MTVRFGFKKREDVSRYQVVSKDSNSSVRRLHISIFSFIIKRCLVQNFTGVCPSSQQSPDEFQRTDIGLSCVVGIIP